MEFKDSNINDINPNQINNIEEIIFPIIKNKNLFTNFCFVIIVPQEFEHFGSIDFHSKYFQ